jgi:hypothetical protein
MDSKILGLFCLSVVIALSAAFPQVPIPAPKGGGYAPDHYFQYINVPKHKVYEWGYKRGNKDHFREEYLSQKDHTFKAKLKWGDSYDGHGEMYYDYNHGPKHHDEYKPVKPVYKPGRR